LSKYRGIHRLRGSEETGESLTQSTDRGEDHTNERDPSSNTVELGTKKGRKEREENKEAEGEK